MTQPGLTDPLDFNRLKRCRYGLMLYNVNDVYIGRSLDLYGEYSQGEMDLLGKFLRPGDLVVDAGANIGTHTLFFARAVGASGTVIAFEPQRLVHLTLCANMALNSVTRAYCYNLAVGAEAGVLRVPLLDQTVSNNFGGLGLGASSRGDPVKVRTLDSLNVSACRLIKADVEGMELAVLRGAAQTIARLRPILYLEYPTANSNPDLVRHVDSLSYTPYFHPPPLFNPNNFLGNPENVFGKTVSANILCIPRELDIQVPLQKLRIP